MGCLVEWWKQNPKKYSCILAQILKKIMDQKIEQGKHRMGEGRPVIDEMSLL